MILYHGSNVVVEYPRLFDNGRPLDFGNGFYLTSNFEQAGKWAHAVTLRKREGEAIVNRYSIDADLFNNLNVLRFEEPSSDWLDFVVGNRKSQLAENQYDAIIGPIADDSTIAIINLYMDGFIDKTSAIERLLPQRLSEQYAFKTMNAVSLLRFEEAIKV